MYRYSIIFLITFLANYLSAQFSDPRLILAPFTSPNILVGNLDATDSDDILICGYQTFKWYSFDYTRGTLVPRDFDFELQSIQGITVGDIDIDEDDDIVLFEKESRRILLIINDLQNSFHIQAIDTLESAGSAEFKIVDIDKDGMNDIVAISDNNSPEVVIYFQTSAGVFEKKIVQSEDRDYKNLLVFDMNGDANFEIMVMSDHSNSRFTIFEKSSETNWTATDFSSFFNVREIKIADLDQDGYGDIISAECGGIYWYKGSLGYSFEKKLVKSGNYCSGKLEVIDIDGDEDCEIVSTTETVNSSLTLVHKSAMVDGEINFSVDTVSSAVSGSYLTVADFNNDNFSEIILGKRYPEISNYNSETKKYSEPSYFSSSIFDNYSFYDFDKDGDPDLAGISESGFIVLENIGADNMDLNHIPIFYVPFDEIEPDWNPERQYEIEFLFENLDEDEAPEVLLAFKIGDKGSLITKIDHIENFNFANPVTLRTTSSQLNFSHLVDLNNDSYNDIIYWNSFNKRIEKQLNNGDGSFGESSFLISNLVNPRNLSSYDIDRDGDQDVFFPDFDIYWILNENSGQGSLNSTSFIRDFSFKVEAADFDLNGEVDFIRNHGATQTRIILNSGAFNFDKNEIINVNRHFVLSDFDNNGSTDILGGNMILLNRNRADTELFERFDTLFFAPQQQINTTNIIHQDLNGDNKKDICYRTIDTYAALSNFDFSTSTSIPTVLIQPLKIYPNPTRNYITVNRSDKSVGRFVITDINGREVASHYSSLLNIEIPVFHLTSGLYLIYQYDQSLQLVGSSTFIKH